ncbi:type IV secretory system conjugative DNA transfer family protein [Priestia sp. FSL R5-0680]|uniref:type IV secretory system conjugative DNA transfer family protein n=1 Tax=Priestia sp. FSL R5-0680 TaxID=2921582 RepID=UPI0030FBCB25
MPKKVATVINSNEILSATFNPFDYVISENDAREVAREIIITTINEDKLDFWSNAQISLLESLLLYVKYEHPEDANLNKVKQLLDKHGDTRSSMDALFDGLSTEHPAFLAYMIVKKSPDPVINHVLVGLENTLSNIYSTPVL